eukprot:gene14292-19_t
MRLGTNQPMGPLRLADFIGLDTCLSIMKVLHNGLGDSKYRPCPLLQSYVDAGWVCISMTRSIRRTPSIDGVTLMATLMVAAWGPAGALGPVGGV